MSKKVSFQKAALEKLVQGLDIAADAVGGTLGPQGRNVYLQEVYGNKITNDGVTVASKVILSDPEEDAGAWVIRNVTGETNDGVGDGTTTTAVLTQALVHALLERPENPMELRTSLNEALGPVLAKLKEASTPITADDVERVALISAEDPTLAKMVSDLIKKLGVNAVIGVEDSKTLETSYDIVDGYEAPNGFLSPYFVNDTKSGKATLVDTPVLVADRKIANITDIKNLFDQLAKAGIGQCVIVCDDIDDSMLGVFVVNKLQGKFSSIVVKAHGETLKDIAGAVGATLVSESNGVTFQNLKLDHLGHATKVTSDQNKTLFIGEGGKDYADLLEKELENEPNQYLKKKLEERIAKLRGGIAVLRIAAPTDLEREYLKLKAEDAIKAVQAALAEGVVVGGGWALWNIAQGIVPNTPGEQILKKALVAPARKIIENGGRDYAEFVSQGLHKVQGAHVIDPTKVERVALQNAVSAAGTLITTSALITDLPNVKE